jgi:hypothetical protein
MADAATQERLSLWGALKDLGWLPLALMGLGGLSVIDILESAIVRRDLDLVSPLRWVLDGYARLTGLIGAIVEPALAPFISQLSEWLHLKLALQPHWRPLFLLGLVFASGMGRTMDEDTNQAPGGHLVFAACAALAAFAAAVVVGLMPLGGHWWMQGLAAAAPAALLTLSIPAATVIDDARRRRKSETGDAVFLSGVVAVFAFALGAGLAFAPGIGDGAGVAGLALFILLIGLLLSVIGLREGERLLARWGLVTLGGFVAAALILLANAALRFLAMR